MAADKKFSTFKIVSFSMACNGVFDSKEKNSLDPHAGVIEKYFGSDMLLL